MQKKFRRPLEFDRRPSYLLREEYDRKLKERMNQRARGKSPVRQKVPDGKQEEPQPARAAETE